MYTLHTRTDATFKITEIQNYVQWCCDIVIIVYKITLYDQATGNQKKINNFTKF